MEKRNGSRMRAIRESQVSPLSSKAWVFEDKGYSTSKIGTANDLWALLSISEKTSNGNQERKAAKDAYD